MQNQPEIDKIYSNLDTNLQPVSSPFFSFSSKIEELPLPCEEISALDNKYTRWTHQEDQKLKEIILSQGTKDWDKISDYFSNKSAKQCQYRWYRSVKHTIDQVFTKEEDDFIATFLKKEGTDKTENWIKISNFLGKPVKSIKDRWTNKLLNNKNTAFTPKDDVIILHLVKNFGTCWSKIIKFQATKSEIELKNRCYSILRKFANDDLKNINNLKKQDVMIYIQKALNELCAKLGQGQFGEIIKYLPTNENKENISASQKKVVNVCEKCINNLKETLKKKLMARMLKRQIANLVDENSNVNLSINENNIPCSSNAAFNCLNLDIIKETVRKGLILMQNNNL